MGTELTAHAAGGEVDFADRQHGTTMAVEAQRAGGDWTISRVRLGPSDAHPEHTVTLSFSPALAPGAQSHFDLLAGKKTKLAAGTVETGGGGGMVTEKWLVAAPDWAKGKAATASATAVRSAADGRPGTKPDVKPDASTTP